MSSFWTDKRVFITGHTGFKGAWLCACLIAQGAKIYGYSLKPKCKQSLYTLLDGEKNFPGEYGDIRNLQQLKKSLQKYSPEIIFHLAAQPLVRTSYKDPIETYSTNVMGTVNILELAKDLSKLKAIVNVTTDKCYQNKEWYWGYREDEPMGGHDPYSASKGCSELITNSYIKSYYLNMGVGLASARAGNVIGGGDWSEDRLLPDLIKGLYNNEKVLIRNQNAIRPWQHVLEPISGYIVLAEKLFLDQRSFSGPWNFGPLDQDARTVGWVADRVCVHWGNGATWNPDSSQHPHEAKYLKLDISKAKHELGWEPKWSVHEAIEHTVDWYSEFKIGGDISEFTEQQIALYMQAQKNG